MKKCKMPIIWLVLSEFEMQEANTVFTISFLFPKKDYLVK